ncbi:MAG TPA: hypothetical protein VMU50_05100 [Polyangia bacterium]|nr:hypothetical protein [Polyangia bacterium]
MWVCAALALGGAACRGGCAGPPRDVPAAAGRLAPFPVEARVVAAFDFAKLRASPLADALAQLGTDSQADKETIAAFTRRTGFDPWRDTDSLVVAFPEDARTGGQFGLVLRARNLDQKRLVAYAREQAAQQGGDLLAIPRGHRTLWSRKGEPDLAGFFIDDRTFAIGAGGWAERMADLSQGGAPSGSAATNLDLARLCDRVAGTPAAIWAAALIPEGTRSQLQAEPRFHSAASISHLGAALDLAHGLSATLLGDLGSAADAQALAAQITGSVRDAKKNPEVLMLGLGPYLDGVAAEASGASFTVRATLADAQVRDLLARASAYLKLARAGQAPGLHRP